MIACGPARWSTASVPSRGNREIQRERAIDRRQLLDQVRLGQGRVATGPIASSLAWAYNPAVTPYALDLARAAGLLDAAGVPSGTDGRRFEAAFVFASGFARTAEVVRENMARLGVGLRLHSLEVNAANQRIRYWWLVETDLLRAHRTTIRDLRVWAGDLLEQAWISRTPADFRPSAQ